MTTLQGPLRPHHASTISSCSRFEFLKSTAASRCDLLLDQLVAIKGICLNICFILNCGNNKVTGDVVNKILSTHSSLEENSARTCLITYNYLKLCPGNRGILVSNSLLFSKTYTCQKEKTYSSSYIVISRML